MQAGIRFDNKKGVPAEPITVRQQQVGMGQILIVRCYKPASSFAHGRTPRRITDTRLNLANRAMADVQYDSVTGQIPVICLPEGRDVCTLPTSD